MIKRTEEELFGEITGCFQEKTFGDLKKFALANIEFKPLLEGEEEYFAKMTLIVNKMLKELKEFSEEDIGTAAFYIAANVAMDMVAKGESDVLGTK